MYVPAMYFEQIPASQNDALIAQEMCNLKIQSLIKDFVFSTAC